jgi:hypothetical protein
MVSVFNNFNLADFWEDSEYALTRYISPPFTSELISSIEDELGYKFPNSYAELMRCQNGGIPKNRLFPTNESTSWAQDHIAISAILGIGVEETIYSICGKFGSKFWIEAWGYPDIGIYFATCPSGGHDLVCLDYRKNGKNGEPEVVHVDQEYDYKITFLAENFEVFIKGLVNEEEWV